MVMIAAELTGDIIMSLDEIMAIRAAVSDKGLGWSAGATSMTKLSDADRAKYLGLKVDAEEMKAMKATLAHEDALAASEGIAFSYPSSWDWRSVASRDWTTSIKDQKGCGACVSFATTAVVESNLEIFRRNPYLEPDLSEADLFFCGGAKCTGWSFEPALNYVRDRGIPDDACFPYKDQDQPCKTCSDRAKRIIKIQGWRKILNESQAKEWIYRHGPLVSGMAVYDDFFSYRGGVYRHARGDLKGYHAIAVVGFNEAERCWICKNSWNTSWGEKGWFKIGYGECELGRSFCFYTAEFPALNDDIIMPKAGKVVAKFKSKSAGFDNEFQLAYPTAKTIFKAVDSLVGKSFDVGTFSAGQRLIFALKTPDGNTYYTLHAWNKDACDHVIKVQRGTTKWDLAWEDLYGLGDRDYNDVVVEIEVV